MAEQILKRVDGHQLFGPNDDFVSPMTDAGDTLYMAGAGNVAPTGTASASSVGDGQGASNAINGTTGGAHSADPPGNGWRSGGGGSGAWLKVTLPTAMPIAGANVWLATDGSRQFASHEVQYSTDDVAWTTVATAPSWAHENNHVFDSVTARYWRVLCGFSGLGGDIIEFQLLGSVEASRLAAVDGGYLHMDGTTPEWLTGAEVRADLGLSNAAKSAVNFIIDGGTDGETRLEITTGVKGFVEVPFAGTITAGRLFADQSGSIVVDVWKDTYANYPPADADSITASAPLTLSSATKSQDTTLTGWATSVAEGDILAFNVDSASTVTQVTVSLRITKA